MKNLFITLISVIISLVGNNGVQAQITITSADLPAVGDTLRYSTATIPSGTPYNYQATGINHQWDFSNLQHASQGVDTFVSVNTTPIFYYPSFLNNASQAKKGQNMGMGSFNLNNVYDFFKKTPNYYTQVGFAATLNGIPIPTLYDSPDYLYRFPLSYGHTDSCYFGYNITIPTLFSYHNQTKRVNIVDGWGTITTPAGTFQTIRIQSVVTSRDSVVLDSLPIPFPPTTTVTTEYKWLANGYRTPVLQAVQPAFGPATVTYLDTYKPVAGIENTGVKKVSFEVRPNPAKDHVVLTIHPSSEENSPMHWQIYRPDGAMVKEGNFFLQDSPIYINIEDLASGAYILTLRQNDHLTGQFKMIKQ